MTIADRQHAATLRRLSVAPTPVLRWLVIRWDVRDSELRGTLEWLIVDDHTRRADVPAAVAVWRPDASPAGRVVSSIPAVGPDAAALVRSRDDLALEHLDIPGLLSVTIHRAESGAATVLYARTSVLAALGVRGGRADSPLGSIVHSAHDELVVPR